MSEPEFVHGTHITFVRDDPDDPNVGIEDTLTPACDFCLDTRIRWEYDCEDFTMPEIGFASTLGWVACDRCSELIDAGDVHGLAERSLRSWKVRMGFPAPEGGITIRMIQGGFWSHRSGPRTAFG